MKNILYLTLILSLLLVACEGSVESAENVQDSNENIQGLPLSSTLAIGTLKLEGTDLAIASDQASDLLPLWGVLKTLIESDASANEEIDVVVQQIQGTMTAEQMASIEAMELDREDVLITMQELGLEFGGGEGRPEGSGSDQGPVGGGGRGGGELSPEQIATAQAHRAESGERGFSSRMLVSLIPELVELLESKIN